MGSPLPPSPPGNYGVYSQVEGEESSTKTQGQMGRGGGGGGQGKEIKAGGIENISFLQTEPFEKLTLGIYIYQFLRQRK